MDPETQARYDAADRLGRIRITKELQKKRNAERAKNAPAVPVRRKMPKKSEDRMSVMQQILQEEDVDPIRELLKMSKRRGKGGLVAKDRLQLYKFLVPYITPTLKAIDVQQETKMTVNVEVTSFRGTTQDELRAEAIEVDASEYDEFDESNEDENLIEEATHESGDLED